MRNRRPRSAADGDVRLRPYRERRRRRCPDRRSFPSSLRAFGPATENCAQASVVEISCTSISGHRHLTAVFQMAEHRHRIGGGGGHDVFMLAHPGGGAIVKHHAVFAQHQPVAAFADGEGGEGVGIDAVKESARIGALDVDLAQGGDIADARRICGWPALRGRRFGASGSRPAWGTIGRAATCRLRQRPRPVRRPICGWASGGRV